jgi:hypothetical protein
MVKLVQICASQNDLFGLDRDGFVYQYNFSSQSWVRLGREWAEPGAGPPAAHESAPRSRDTPPPPPRGR